MTAQTSLPTGVKFLTDSGKAIVNWPEQHRANGVAKNTRTGNRFKYIVRALKRLKFYMAENGNPEMESVPSYLIECLVYSAPDSYLDGDSYYENVLDILARTIVGAEKPESCCNWKEVNEKKLIFGAGQPWTHTTAYKFSMAAWRTVGAGT